MAAKPKTSTVTNVIYSGLKNPVEDIMSEVYAASLHHNAFH